MTYIHKIKLKELHYIFISLNEFTIQIIHIYREVGRTQKCIEEDQIKLI
jgi:hypothetical protein